MNEVPETYTREMGVSHADFHRILPRAMNGHDYAVRGDTVHASVHGGTLTIELGEERRRRIALLAIPYTEVRFRFEAVAPADRATFKRHFDLSFQRGGG